MQDRPSNFFEGTEMPTTGWWEKLWPDPAAVLASVGLRPGMDAVDLCSGAGWFTLQIAKIARNVTAIDIDPHLLEVTRRRLAGGGVKNFQLVEADAYELAKRVTEHADFVFMANVFHGVPDRTRLAAVVRRVLRPGGYFAVINWQQRPREETVILGEPRGPKTELRISPETTIQAAEAGGLKLAQLVDLPPYHYGVVLQRPNS